MPDSAPVPPDFAAILSARARIAPHVHRTPVLTSSRLDARAGASLFFKCENFQRCGAFKARGAHNAVFALTDAEAARGVLTHSSGNHGAALALAASRRGIPATVVIPENAPASKIEGIRRYGATVSFCAPPYAAREAAAASLLASTGACLIHPFNDPRVIAGQGTAALEFLEEIPNLEILVAPVGGGGLMSGSAIAARGVSSSIRLVGVEPSGADDAARSLRAGRLIERADTETIADGLRSASLGQLTFEVIRREIEAIVTVSENEIVAAMRLVWQVLKIVIEPSSAVVLAAVIADSGRFRGKRVGLIFSGGNVDLDSLPWMRTEGGK